MIFGNDYLLFLFAYNSYEPGPTSDNYLEFLNLGIFDAKTEFFFSFFFGFGLFCTSVVLDSGF